MSYIIHLAVSENNMTMIRYLIENPAFFRLFSEKKETSKINGRMINQK